MVSVGQQLREERIKKNLSIEEVARATKIRPQFIRDIEQGDFVRLPSSAYAVGFVKNYVSFLGLSSRDILAKFRREYDAKEHRTVLPESLLSQKQITVKRFYWGRYLFMIAVITVPILFYIFFQYRGFFLGPSLLVTSPTEHAVFQASEISVEGNTDANNSVTINGMPTFVDSFGHFKKIVPVFVGNNSIHIFVVNGFGKSKAFVRDILIKNY